MPSSATRPVLDQGPGRSAVVYLRTSGLGQVEREGPKVQEDDCRRYANAHGMVVTAVVHEAAVTGTTDDRPAFADALLMIEDGRADVLLVSSLDRLARTLTVQVALLVRAWRAGAEVHAASFGLVAEDDPDDPMRTAMRQMAGVFAQLDKSMTVLRLRKAREKAAPAGKRQRVGQRPFPCGDRERAVLALVTARAEAGDDWLSIATALNNRPGWTNRAGRPWTGEAVRRIHRRFVTNR